MMKNSKDSTAEMRTRVARGIAHRLNSLLPIILSDFEIEIVKEFAIAIPDWQRNSVSLQIMAYDSERSVPSAP